MSWTKDEEGHSHFKEAISDHCFIKIEPWEHGYFVSVANKDDPEEVAVVLQYFYTFQDARSFFTSLNRLIKRSVGSKNRDNTNDYL